MWLCDACETSNESSRTTCAVCDTAKVVRSADDHLTIKRESKKAGADEAYKSSWPGTTPLSTPPIWKSPSVTTPAPVAMKTTYPAAPSTETRIKVDWAFVAQVLAIAVATGAAAPILSVSVILLLVAGLLGVFGAAKEFLAVIGGICGFGVAANDNGNVGACLIAAAIGAGILYGVGYVCEQGASGTMSLVQRIWNNWPYWVGWGAVAGFVVGAVFVIYKIVNKHK